MRNLVTIIADASYCNQTKAAGYGIWIAGSNGSKSFEGPLRDPSDNNVAELMAIGNALYHGIRHNLIVEGDRLLIQSDSDTAIKILSGEKKPYCDQIQNACEYILGLLKSGGYVATYKHVPGHTKGTDRRTRAQNLCDLAALRQMRLKRDTILSTTSEMPKPFRRKTNYLRSTKRGKVHG
jgi:ribonuclease HI